MKTWNTAELKSALEKMKADGKVFAYNASHTTIDRQEFYLIQDAKTRVALDQARQVDVEKTKVQLFIKKADGRLGSAGKPLLKFQPLEPQLLALAAAAEIGDEELWELPQTAAASVPVSNVFPALKENFQKGAQAIHADLTNSIAKTEGIFNSAELFVNLEKTLHLASNGFEHSEERSRIYTEVCFSSENKNKDLSEEFLITQWYGHPEQVDLKKMCEDSREFAEASLDTKKPESGSYAVILHADVLSDLWNTCLSQLDSQGQYFKHPFLEPGTEFIKGFEGDAFDLSVDPKVHFCFASQDYNSYGVPQKKLRLAGGNKVLASLTSPRFAQYLKKPMTTDWGCVVVEPASSKPLAELKKSQPKVLEILQFSGLFTDHATLTYSSEIRLARLYDNEKGTVTYIKGGNLSGNLMENFRGVRWSQERSLFNHSDYSGRGLGYSGPSYALVTGVSVSS